MIPRTVLIAPEAFGEGLDAQRVAAAIGCGIRAADATLAVELHPLEVDLCPLEIDLCPPHEADRDRLAIRTFLESVDFDLRMRAARALIVGAGRLDEATLLGSATFEIATRARQAGVPAYAVAGTDALHPFDARILDLQAIVEACDARALRRAGERLAALV